jgi:DNA repair exonuclease SbcCD ATPase subunit
MTREAYQNETEKLSNQVTAYTDKIAELETQIRRLEIESGQENAFVERFSKQVCINELTRVIVDEFIEAIHVYTSDRIEIILNYKDEFERLQNIMESENQGVTP